MQPRIELLKEKRLAGVHLSMSLIENKTGELWRSFMPRRKEITNRVGNELVSMQVYNEPVKPGDLYQSFEKWACMEVTDFNNIPSGIQTYTLAGGLYAVFNYKGLSTDTAVFRYIFGTWLPGSDYTLDNRPHFEVLGEKYKNNDPDSEEDIWIPVRLK